MYRVNIYGYKWDRSGEVLLFSQWFNSHDEAINWMSSNTYLRKNAKRYEIIIENE